MRLQATAEANNLVLHKDLLDFYVDKMQKLVNDAQFFSDNELENVHQKTKSETVEMVSNRMNDSWNSTQFLIEKKKNITVSKETKAWRR